MRLSYFRICHICNLHMKNDKLFEKENKFEKTFEKNPYVKKVTCGLELDFIALVCFEVPFF
jgi:hypothetical protein